MAESPRKSLAAAIADGRLVRIDRHPQYEEPIDGIPLAMGRALLLVHVINPDLLLPDGWAVLRVKDVAAVRSRAWDGFVAGVLVEERLLPDPLPVPDLRLGAWAQLLADLHARGERVSVECEEAKDGFFIGALHTAGRDEVEIQHVDAGGRWEYESWWIRYRDITRVRFGSRYIEVFCRYAVDSLGPVPG
ncbi:MAG TPA: hypothetical protein VLK84_21445 [Longimicrobium sp.]|nr:hypothetical protein [Longimicrobium sp.]